MAELKTKKNKIDVEQFLNSIENPQRRKDGISMLKIMSEVSGEKAEMWGPSIIGFGSYQYKYASGREGDWMLCGFSPRKQSLTLYIMTGFSHYEDLLNQLGKYKTGKSCLYINKLEDVDEQILRKLILQSIQFLREKKR